MIITNEDNMDLMARYDDNHFDLAIVDPEYKDASENQPTQQMRAKGDMTKWYGRSDIKYFQELKRVSKNQIIWGGNYYAHFLDENNNWIIWHKNNAGTGFSMCEMAWNSIRKNVQMVSIRAPQTLQHEGIRIHPTQKPVKLYEWLLMNYATCKTCNNKSGFYDNNIGGRDKHCSECGGDKYKILDTHLGSGSIAIACHNLGFDLTACELDKEYFDSAMKRIENHKAQIRMF